MRRLSFLLSALLMWGIGGILPVTAQPTGPAPEFLFRDGNQLVLVNGYTGETTTLSLEVTDDHEIIWSPDGQSLLVRYPDPDADNHESYCMNIYDVEVQQWHYNDPFVCGNINDVMFAPYDVQQIFYTTDSDFSEYNDRLWRYHLQDDSQEVLYNTSEGNDYTPEGLNNLEWSPNANYLTFTHYRRIMGGSLNRLVILNPINDDYQVIRAPDTYYASYHPVWSPDETHFLIELKEEYVTSGMNPRTNHRGDVYLINVTTGERQRLTYTPALSEYDVRWIDNSQFTYTVQQEIVTTLTVKEARSIDPVPPDEQVQPEPFTPDNTEGLRDLRVSPQRNYGAWVNHAWEDDPVELKIGFIGSGGLSSTPDVYFSASIPSSYRHNNVLIGWRPMPESE